MEPSHPASRCGRRPLLVYGAFNTKTQWKCRRLATKGLGKFRNRESSGLERGSRKFGRGLPNLLPYLIPPNCGFCREGDDSRRGIRFGQAFQRIAQLIVGEPVALGCDQKEVASRRIEKV